jgi:hypothetical protein
MWIGVAADGIRDRCNCRGNDRALTGSIVEPR